MKSLSLIVMQHFLHIVDDERKYNSTLPEFERDPKMMMFRKNSKGEWWCTARFDTKDKKDIVTVQQVYSRELVDLLQGYLGDLD